MVCAAFGFITMGGDGRRARFGGRLFHHPPPNWWRCARDTHAAAPGRGPRHATILPPVSSRPSCRGCGPVEPSCTPPPDMCSAARSRSPHCSSSPLCRRRLAGKSSPVRTHCVYDILVPTIVGDKSERILSRRIYYPERNVLEMLKF